MLSYFEDVIMRENILHMQCLKSWIQEKIGKRCDDLQTHITCEISYSFIP